MKMNLRKLSALLILAWVLLTSSNFVVNAKSGSGGKGGGKGGGGSSGGKGKSGGSSSKTHVRMVAATTIIILGVGVNQHEGTADMCEVPLCVVENRCGTQDECAEFVEEQKENRRDTWKKVFFIALFAFLIWWACWTLSTRDRRAKERAQRSS